MKIIFCTLLLLLTLTSYGQYMFPEKQKGCQIIMFDLENDSILTKYKTIDSLAIDIYNQFNPEYRNILSGNILIQILVDIDGKPCCLSIENNTKVKSARLSIVNSINSLRNWTKPMKNGKPTNVCALLKITFNEGEIILERLGFNYYSKYKTLDKVIIKR